MTQKIGWILVEFDVDSSRKKWRIVGFGEKRKHRVVFEKVHSAKMYDGDGVFVEGVRPESVSTNIRLSEVGGKRNAKYITKKQAMLEVM
jgi:nucleotide-binding universal stress UspA family protein